MSNAQMDTHKKSLVLVVGAGASKEVNLPIGSELKKQISNCLRFYDQDFLNPGQGDGLLGRALQLMSQNSSDFSQSRLLYSSKSNFIARAMPLAISIDNFIDAHRDDKDIEICGKLAITRCILDAESNSTVYAGQRYPSEIVDFSKLENTWLAGFFKLLTENCHKSDLRNRFQKVAVICFNYDRCIEQFFYVALQTYYGIEPKEAASIIGSLRIFHPYGKVGSLPWMLSGDRQDAVDFGRALNEDTLIKTAQQIRTFTEGTDPADSDINALRNIVKSAERLAFIGFAYHPLNLELLFPTKKRTGLVVYDDSSRRKIIGTSLGMSASNTLAAKNSIAEALECPVDDVQLSSVTCSELVSNFSRFLALV